MKITGKANDIAKKILEQFENPEALPEALAQVFVNRANPNVPCHSWSWSNQMIAALFGHGDARGFRQWEKAGRRVMKGEKAFHILAPLMGKGKKENKAGVEESYSFIYGFKAIPVFGLHQTDGNPIDSDQEDEDKWIDSLPVIEVAKEWNLNVNTYNGEESNAAGYYTSNGAIALGVRNLSTWAHELIHAADHKLNGLKAGQQLDQEVVAEFGGAVLLKSLGMDNNADLGGAYKYVQHDAEKNNKDVLSVVLQLINRTCEAVSLILDTAEKLDAVAV